MKRALLVLLLASAAAMWFEPDRVDVMGYDVPRPTRERLGLTYGGVTLSNSVTGTGSMALSASPTFTATGTSGTSAVVTYTIGGGGGGSAIPGPTSVCTGSVCTLTTPTLGAAR